MTSMIQLLTNMAGIISGIVAMIALTRIVDGITRGWLRKKIQLYLGIEQLREDHNYTQTFLMDLGDSHNELTKAVCEENNISKEERPGEVRTAYYYRSVKDDGDVERGDFRSAD